MTTTPNKITGANAGESSELHANACNALESAHTGKDVHCNRFKTTASFGVGAGIVAMLFGNGLGMQGPDLFLVGGVVSLSGWALLIWGCVNYMRWKGYSGWFGLLGYLLLPGLIILACFPNRRRHILQTHGWEPAARMEPFLTEDRTFGYRFLLTLAPLLVLLVGLIGFVTWSGSNIDTAEWREVAHPGTGFQALMPGRPQLEEKMQETPAGNVEMHKFTVPPKNKKGLFVIVSLRFPEALGAEMGGAEKMLELGRHDLLTASQGRLQSEKSIVLSGYSGLELEILPPKGAIIKSRIYARKNHLYQVSAYVSKIRLNSKDAQKFFDSFKLSADPDIAPEGTPGIDTHSRPALWQ